MIARPRLVLASASPRRAALLGQAVIKPDEICAPEIDETPKRGELPRDYVRRMANEKAMTVARLQDNAIVLAADTVVACGRRILPKAESDCEVESCLKLLSGRRHRVLTAVTVASEGGKKIRTRIVTTQVSFKRISANEISHYVSSKEGLGKAGGYAIQGLAETFARRINGSYSNIVGLPLAESLSLLAAVGYQTH